nr:hypothetical protein [Tanacetum cinerariifolium]
LTELYTKLVDRVLNLETTKTAQAKEISSLKRRVKRLEKKKRSGTHGLKRLYKVGLSAKVESSAKEQSLGEKDASKQGRNIADIVADAKITLVDETVEDQRSTIASAIICLATNQKFNFSKYIFESMVKHLDTGNKFLMYPRFMQVFLDKQVDGISKHNAIYVISSHIKKVFGNMKWVGKGFFKRDTPLFPTMMVQTQEEELGEGSTMASAP